jgi:hypothetical protein
MKRNNQILIIIFSLMFFMKCDKSPTEPEIEQNSISGRLVLNEFLAINSSTNIDELGEYDDWIELYNGTQNSIDIAGMFLTDDPDDSIGYKIPGGESTLTTIPSNGFLLLWADNDTSQGILHLGFKLSGSGESILLRNVDGISIVDSVSFDAQLKDISQGRKGDDMERWIKYFNPTPGLQNN